MGRARTLHAAYGLTIASEIPLIDLPPATGQPAVVVTIGRLDFPRPTSDVWTVVATPDEVRGWIPSGGAFVVRGGTSMVVDPADDADDGALRLAIVGPLLGVLLSQRGCFVLHASTVAVDGSAAAFIGPSGCGKSTLSAALAAAGHPVVADDLTIVDMCDGRPFVRPGLPRLKLWPDTATALHHDVETLTRLHPRAAKRSLPVEARVHEARVPLTRCYVLQEGDEAIVDVSATQSILMLVACTYQARWMHDAGGSAQNLGQAAALAGSGVVRMLRRPRTYDALPQVIRRITDDLASARQSAGS